MNAASSRTTPGKIVLLLEAAPAFAEIERHAAAWPHGAAAATEAEAIAVCALNPGVLLVAGVASATRLRAQPEFSKTAILAYAHVAGDDDWRELADSMADDIIAAPFSRAEFFARCARALKRRGGDRDGERRQRDRETGMLTQSALNEAAQRMAAEAGEAGVAMVAVTVRLDGLDRIETDFGRPIAQQLVLAASRRLDAHAWPGATVARLYDGRFAFIAPRPGDHAKRTSQLQELMAAPFSIAGEILAIEPVLGVAVSRAGESVTALLLRSAAAGAANREGAPAIAQLVTDVAQALRSGDFVLQYQPQFSLVDGKLAGAEALLRWNRGGRGLTPPAGFLDAALRFGLGEDITAWVLRQAALEAHRWAQPGARPPRVSINVGARETLDGALERVLRRFFDSVTTPGIAIDIEIPAAGLAAVAGAHAMLETIAALGVSLTLDAGRDLSRFDVSLLGSPCRRLKIERSVLESPDLGIIFERVRASGAEVAVHGIEDARGLALARGAGCVEAQGYFLGRPVFASGLASAGE